MRTRGFEVISSYQGRQIALPARKTSASAGYDIAAAEDVTVLPGKVTMIPTGLKAYMPADEYLGIHIRSGLAVKQSLGLINGQGIIDADYYNNPDNEGHILVAMFNFSGQPVHLTAGTRIAQGIFYSYRIADHDEQCIKSSRTGGFGSTGQ